MHFLRVGTEPIISSQPSDERYVHSTDASSQRPTQLPTPPANTSPQSGSKDSVAEAARDPSWATPAVRAGENVPLSFLLLLLRMWQRLARFLGSFLPLMLVLVGFAAFVVTNGGIVVGDRSQHRISLHFMQPLYCAACVALSLLPLIFHPSSLRSLARSLISSLQETPVRTLSLAAATALGIFFSIRSYRY